MAEYQILCRYFALGACKKGEACQFSHDPTARPSYVCSFFLRGNCQFGSHCRYEHVEPRSAGHIPYAGSSYAASIQRSGEAGTSVHRMQQQATRTSPAQHDHHPLAAGPTTSSQGDRPGDADLAAGSSPDLATWVPNAEANASGTDHETSEDLNASAGGRRGERHPSSSLSAFPSPEVQRLAEQSICTAFSVNGSCPRGSACPKMHGTPCPFCEKRCIHPYRPQEVEEHLKMCERKQKRLQALLRSQEVECSVCLEKVLSKQTVAERKFGIMSHCDHAFCIMCIRGWRQGSHGSHMDVDTVVRACPVCRVQSHYITPSMVWFFSPEEKEGIISGYKSKLKSIECKYFKFGDAKCPFGSSCFYRHAFRDGSLEETRLRHLGGGDGTVIAKDVRLSDFLEELDLNNRTRRGGRGGPN